MKIAVVGGGISGLGAAWILSRRHEVHLFEAAPRLGGHAHTVTVHEENRAVPMDTGFLVYNELTYPNLIRFFEHLGVETVASDMSLSIQSGDGELEWSGTNLNSIFGQRMNLLRPRFHRMLLDILRFARQADELLLQARRHAWTLGEVLAAGRFSREFSADYLLPIGGAIWSTSPRRMLEFPAETFLTFFMNHKLLQVNNRPVWRTVKNGSINYVQRAARGIGKIHLASPVREVERLEDGVRVRTARDEGIFDRVVLAAHAPQILQMLARPTASERRVLGAIAYQPNLALLHRDRAVMPRSRRCWSSWNVAAARPGQTEDISLSYYLNKLQPLETSRDYFITLNARSEPAELVEKIEYEHPQFDQEAIRAQSALPSIQGTGGVYFAGAWSRYGFHEDGLLSAVRVCELLGVEAPWKT